MNNDINKAPNPCIYVATNNLWNRVPSTKSKVVYRIVKIVVSNYLSEKRTGTATGATAGYFTLQGGLAFRARKAIFKIRENIFTHPGSGVLAPLQSETTVAPALALESQFPSLGYRQA